MVGLREVPEIVREGISLSGFPLVYESSPIEAILFYYIFFDIYIFYINYRITNCCNSEIGNRQMNTIKLVEGTHYRRRYNQPSPTPAKSKELVSYLFCDTSRYPDDAAHAAERVGRNKRCKGVVRLDKLMKHITTAHPDRIPAEGRSRLDMGFTMGNGGDVAPESPELTTVDDVRN